MAARKVSAAQAKAAKQKKIAIIGVVLLIPIMVIQGPKMLKLVTGGGSATPATAAPVTPVPVAPVPGATPVSATTSAQPDGATLVSFETFTTKDPFVSQLKPATTASTPATTTTTPAETPTTSQTATGSSTAGATSSGSTPAKSTPTTFSSTEKLAPGSAKITVNGKTEVVATSADFPKSDPTFTLVSVGSNTAQIAIAGGSLKAGGKTFTITTAKSTTLLNTANDKQYTLKLVSTAPQAA